MRFLKRVRQATLEEGLDITIKAIAVVVVAYHLIAVLACPQKGYHFLS